MVRILEKMFELSLKGKPAKVTNLAGQGFKAVEVTENSRPQRGNFDQKCRYCSQSHALKECKDFQQGSYDDRLKFIRSNKLCDNCYRPRHMAKGCMLKSLCDVRGYTWKHQTLLHPPRRDKGSKEEGAKSTNITSANGAGDKNESHITSKPGGNQGGSVNATITSMQRVCRRVVLVRMQGKESEVQTWALLDSRSDSSLCDRRLMEQLDLQGVLKKISLATFNNGFSEKSEVEVSLTVKTWRAVRVSIYPGYGLLTSCQSQTTAFQEMRMSHCGHT